MFLMSTMLRGKTSVAMRLIEESKEEFYLTGSRYFGGHTLDSDWDFFVQDSPLVREELKQANFEVREDYTGLHHVAAVYKLGDVHIQLVTNAKLKDQVQRKLRSVVPVSQFDKQIRKWIWVVAYAMFSLDE